jgi:dienelactone hydrolase
MRSNWLISKWIGKALLGLLILLFALTIAFLWWGNNPREAMPEALRDVESDQKILVSHGEWMTFRPGKDTSMMGIIFYPGGHVDPRAYAPLAKRLAVEGNLVIIPHMPLNLAVFGVHMADEIISAYPDIELWIIGGHSLGGAMAVEYVSENPSSINGLFLLASYFSKNTNLRAYKNLPVLTIYGTEDSDFEKIRASRERLPPNTAWYEIEGGNHGQFGWYGKQPGDGKAGITREAQQEQIIDHTLKFLNRVRSKPQNMK